ncbi:chemotaxis protein CheW [Vibrio sp. JPW-9-11-11]|uniref:chemotaxis protein CheW n=1 Tax=Vibrio sp. JPW-9-11-11 TaxID=1416532 RepID=UPI001593396C|nr:chemotaxis protein CheW [Vibrio sp. JPW-9-11-11]NVD06187.1 chemotaxis protein CheW [Vibrio sp. JPW-9-11-11]
MTSQSLLSSEQALDDYFSALLEEVVEEFEPHESAQEPALAAVAQNDSLELAPMMQSVEEKSYFHLPTEEVEVPDLEDVERLLKQLETTNPVADLELEQVMEQNTVEIAQAQPEIAVDEIQEWDIDEPAVDIAVDIAEPQVETITEVEQQVETVQPRVDIDVDPQVDLVDDQLLEVDQAIETKAGDSDLNSWQSTQRDVEFQVLYFDVNDVTFAVPLDELGGIHRTAEMNHLIGRPDWYLGLQTSRESQLDVVDTAKWVMSEKLKDDSYKENYQYIVMLGESMWGLASTQLMGTEALDPAMVRWRETAGKRPWLAGMVKEKMCALIHVEALIAMLNAGLDVKALDN